MPQVGESLSERPVEHLPVRERRLDHAYGPLPRAKLRRDQLVQRLVVLVARDAYCQGLDVVLIRHGSSLTE